MVLRTVYRLVPIVLAALLGACASTPPATSSAEGSFKAGEAAFASKNYEEAIEQFKKVKESYSSPELSAAAELKIADSYFENKAYVEAASEYEQFRKMHPNHPKGAYALYRLGLSHYREITGIDTDQTPVKNALLAFEAFLAGYPDSEYAPEVREKLEDCRAKQLAYEVYVGNFYLRTGKYQPAIKRLTEALARFPRQKHDDTLLKLGKAQIGAGEKERGRETLERLIKEYPQSALVTEARKELAQ